MMGLGTMSGRLLVLLVLFSYIYSFSGQVNPTTRKPLKPCPAQNTRPCRIMYSTFSEGGNVTRTEKEICTCSNSTTCSGNWIPSDRILFAYLATDGESKYWRMKFCDQIKPANFTRLCSFNETALRLSGTETKATNVAFYRCRCMEPFHFHYSSKFVYRNATFYDYLCHALPPCEHYQNCSTFMPHSGYRHPECQCVIPKTCEPRNESNLFANPRCI